MDFEALVRDDYADKRWIIVAEVAAGTPRLVEFLRRSGAGDLFLLAGSLGVGDVPDIPRYDLGTSGSTVMDGIRAFESAVLDLPDAAMAALDEFDPERTAAVLFAGFGTTAEIGGRPVFAPRRQEWLALEDKLAVLDIWREAGIATAPVRVVAPNLQDLSTAHQELDRGAGTVAVADNRDGWHGGGDYLRRIREPSQLPGVTEFLEVRADRVRVMPFMDGIPCSIHAFVTQHGIAAFRPVEMLILWRGDDLTYCGAATTWDPTPADREAMRSAARAIGETLRRRVDYRGAFSLDGVMTSAGFRPTEINTRLSIGLGIQIGDVELPIGALVRHLRVRPDAEIDTRFLEERIVTNADANRVSRAMFITSASLEHAERTVRLAGRDVVDDPDGPIQLSAGPALHGGIVFVRAAADVVPRGASFAPVMAACAPYVEDWLSIDIGRLDYAMDVRAI